MSKIKPCPFCGGKAEIIEGTKAASDKSIFKAFCTKCETENWWSDTKQEAVERWNIRYKGGEH